MTRINFYKTKEPYGCFSNFARYQVDIDGIFWKTSEHYYQARKFLDSKNQGDVFNAETPKEAAAIGRDKNRPLRPDWDSIKDNVMRKVVLAKFQQHEDIRKILLSTGDAELVEHTENDDYWADGKDGKGKNMLGVILMETRQFLKNSS